MHLLLILFTIALPHHWYFFKYVLNVVPSNCFEHTPRYTHIHYSGRYSQWGCFWQKYFVATGPLSYLKTRRRRPFMHDDVIKWKHFSRYWPFVWGIQRYPVISPHRGQWRGALMYALICVWINGWVNNPEAGDLRRYRAHYDVIVIVSSLCQLRDGQMASIWPYAMNIIPLHYCISDDIGTI